MFSLGLYLVTTYIKNPAKALTVKRELLALRDAISAAFPGE